MVDLLELKLGNQNGSVHPPRLAPLIITAITMEPAFNIPIEEVHINVVILIVVKECPVSYCGIDIGEILALVLSKNIFKNMIGVC